MDVGEKAGGDLLRRDAEGAKIFGKPAKRRPHAAARPGVDERPLSGKLEQEGIDRDVQVAAGRADKPRGVGPIYPKNHVE
jgi:hypothetical protein